MADPFFDKLSNLLIDIGVGYMYNICGKYRITDRNIKGKSLWEERKESP